MLRSDSELTFGKQPVVFVTMAQAPFLRVSVALACQKKNVEVLETEFESYNQSPGKGWVWAGLGGGVAAAGTVLLIDAASVGSNSKDQRQYNPIGQRTTRAMGASVLGVGVAALTVAVVDVIRAGATSAETSKTERRKSAMAETGKTCPARGVPGLSIRLGDKVLEKANPKDNAKLDLTSVIEAPWTAHYQRETQVEPSVDSQVVPVPLKGNRPEYAPLLVSSLMLTAAFALYWWGFLQCGVCR